MLEMLRVNKAASFPLFQQRRLLRPVDIPRLPSANRIGLSQHSSPWLRVISFGGSSLTSASTPKTNADNGGPLIVLKALRAELGHPLQLHKYPTRAWDTNLLPTNEGVLMQMILQSSRVVSLGTLSDGAIVERIVLSTGIRGDQVMDGWVMILRADDDKIAHGQQQQPRSILATTHCRHSSFAMRQQNWPRPTFVSLVTCHLLVVHCLHVPVLASSLLHHVKQLGRLAMTLPVKNDINSLPVLEIVVLFLFSLSSPKVRNKAMGYECTATNQRLLFKLA
ncbi:hypothetical protein O0I10_006704 [Lichtheimia ornata]|uniref:Uncharacterized protein n=1 Tax=Lichtheimia ornata TaxID=688661 RepID=A0AAD7XYH0_9FUNG|nr:uncharacterized protein O0I10_006704 [Lichtheimia ornata]KAJ8657638.1 hypothetical protein O0I10_006704 [Lichtheimia ornata]